jgi:hypothetical protein
MIPDGEDRLFGGDSADCVWGGSEDDVLYGGAGNDFVGTYCLDFVMDTGNDIMYAGAGTTTSWPSRRPSRPPPLSRRRISSSAVLAQTPSADKKGLDQVFDCERKNPR